jgi:rhodanese-related sulfurtransferase
MNPRTAALAVALAAADTLAVAAPKTESPAAAQPAAPAGVAPGEVDGAAARKLVAAGVVVVDVRTPEEFQGGHVPGARNIPFDQIGSRVAEIGPPSTPVLLYCRSGRRSGIAAETLRAKGFTQIYDMKSFDRWAEAEKGAR